MPSGVLAWTAQRGCITTPEQVVDACRAGEVVLGVDDDHVIRSVQGYAPLIAAVRLDGHAVRLAQQISDVATRLDELHERLLDIAEAVVDGLARR
jgi:CMP-2-keto-3-deoxyoctulosonic acid synthetase